MKRTNISKNNILENIKNQKGFPISFSEKVLNSIFEIITDGLKRDNILKITGFGTFSILNKKSRIGRNPKTGERHQINSRRVVVFSPSLQVKNKLNGKK
tara:strand:- start:79 stop:375 length:297 start_codon:yes stop_codon:yes gene_type:complete